ncbi:chemotaxis protein CheF1 [Halobacteriales archaeon QS_6_64_34]|nr:MAG: chemotaxis protein CheF1 [Halobacteriales archaeon QS_6_64_34]
MSGEHALVDTKGKFVQVVKDGRKQNDIEWLPGRILLSNKRLVLATDDGKRTIPLSKLTSVTVSQMNQPLAQVEGYVKLQAGRDAWLVSPQDSETFEEELYKTLLDQIVVLVKHPALKGGVVTGATWEKARFKIDEEQEDTVNIAISSGTFVELDIDDVGTVVQKQKEIRGKERPLLEVEHTIDGTSVETHISGSPRHVSLIDGLVRQGEQRNAANVDLSPEETQVLMALYSGISPFKIPDFVDMDIDEVEAVYDRLMEADILEPVRTRREVQLEARGRSIAGDAIADQ